MYGEITRRSKRKIRALSNRYQGPRKKLNVVVTIGRDGRTGGYFATACVKAGGPTMYGLSHVGGHRCGNAGRGATPTRAIQKSLASLGRAVTMRKPARRTRFSYKYRQMIGR